MRRASDAYVSKSDIYPHEVNIDLLDPLIDTYHSEGADSPQEMKGYVPRQKMPHVIRKSSVRVLY